MPKSKATPELRIEPALALLEFNSIAIGMLAGDAMVKRATLSVVHAGTVQPGRFLVLIGGEVAEVEEALKAGREVGTDALNDHIFLAGVHPAVVRALGGGRSPKENEALGIIETRTVAAAIQAADRGVKGAQVNLLEIRLADGLDGKGIVLFTGIVSDVEAALEIAEGMLQERQKIRRVLIPQLHSEMAKIIRSSTHFGAQLGWGTS